MAWKRDTGNCSGEFDAHWDDVNNVFDSDRNWTDAINFRHGQSNAAYNGSGSLICRAKPMGLAGLAPSIRPKVHRRGFQDYEYCWLVKQASQGDKPNDLVSSIVHGLPYGV